MRNTKREIKTEHKVRITHIYMQGRQFSADLKDGLSKVLCGWINGEKLQCLYRADENALKHLFSCLLLFTLLFFFYLLLCDTGFIRCE